MKNVNFLFFEGKGNKTYMHGKKSRAFFREFYIFFRLKKLKPRLVGSFC